MHSCKNLPVPARPSSSLTPAHNNVFRKKLESTYYNIIVHYNIINLLCKGYYHQKEVNHPVYNRLKNFGVRDL